MKDYKLLLAGLMVLLLIVFLGLLTWLYYHNQKNVNPLPILSDVTSASDEREDTADTTTSTLYIQAEDSLQIPLDDVIVRFEGRYPSMQVLVRYVPKQSLITLPNISNYNNVRTNFLLSTDMIIADDQLQTSQLNTLQDVLNDAQAKRNADKQEEADALLLADSNRTDDDKKTPNTAADTDQETSTDQALATSDSNEARSLTSFSYALKDQQAVEGVILTHNPIAVSFRNFLLSSTGQDILNRYEYRNIDGYKKNIDDLFNPTTRSQTEDGEDKVEVADALSNGN